MKFLVDAQLPKALARFLGKRGFDVIHTLELPNKNRTGDLDINRISILKAASSFQKIRTFTIVLRLNKNHTNCCTSRLEILATLTY